MEPTPGRGTYKVTNWELYPPASKEKRSILTNFGGVIVDTVTEGGELGMGAAFFTGDGGRGLMS